MRRKRVLSLFVVLAFLVAGCAYFTGDSTQTQSPLTPQQKFIQAAKSFYISQYKDYEAMTANPDLLTEPQKQILREKKKILVQVKPMIDTYDVLVASGQTPTFDQEQQIKNLLNQIGGKFQ